MRLALIAAAALLASCGGLKPGLTKNGAAFAAAGSLEDARRSAALECVDLLVAPGSPNRARAEEIAKTRAAEFGGKAKMKKGKGVVEVRLAPLAAAFDKAGLLKPEGYLSREPRVMLLVAEPAGILDLGVGPAADALRRGLSARGLSATDGRDGLNGLKWKNGTAAELVAAAKRAGADWLLVAAAGVEASADSASGAWRARATLVADAYKIPSDVPVEQLRSETATLDVSSPAARGKALEQAGDEISEKAAAAVTKSLGGRSEAAVLAFGDASLPRLRTLLSNVRRTEGVAGAYLHSWSGEEGGAIFRVYLLAGLRVDDLAARLLRMDPTLTLMSVESDLGRLAVEIPGAGGM